MHKIFLIIIIIEILGAYSYKKSYKLGVKEYIIKVEGNMIYLGADHAGFALKEHIKMWLTEWGKEFIDCGNVNYDTDDDYPDFAFKVAQNVMKDPKNRGILACTSASGMVIAANKVKGIRAVACFDDWSAEHSREHNDTNVLALPGIKLSEEKAKEILEIWLNTDFGNEERHHRRIKKIIEFENDHFT